MTNDIITAIHTAYSIAYPDLDDNRESRNRMTSDIADAILAAASILADACRMTSDSMIDTANSMTRTLIALNRIAYCDDFTLSDTDALTSTINIDLIRDLHNINCDDSAIRDTPFFAPIFNAMPTDDDTLDAILFD